MLKINNQQARNLWLQTHGLARAPTGAFDLLAIIKNLGFVQLDSIRNVTRAHHHILWSRNQNYREPMLGKCLSQDRLLFEHFTHDASVIPMDFYPMWHMQFTRMKTRLSQSKYYKSMLDDTDRAAMKARIMREGSLSTHAFDTKIIGKKQMWSRPPHKLALDYMWYVGELSTCHRKNFNKYYHLTDRTIPKDIRARNYSETQQIDWLCRAALQRLGTASLRDLQKFWDALSIQEVNDWAARHRQELVPISVQSADKTWHNMFAGGDIETRLAALKPATSRLRILNLFDPTVRDRARLLRLFGFNYRNEIFVPAAKRQWGYYVYLLLEGSKFVGRIELSADRKTGILTVKNLWAEPSVRWTQARAKKLQSELERLARFIGVNSVDWICEPTPRG